MLLDSEYVYEGKKYSLPMHGFLRETVGALTKVSDDHAYLSFSDTPETRSCFPFAFSVVIDYRLEGCSLIITYGGQLSVYVDDITVSGCKNPKQVVTRIRRILFSYGYRMADNKSRIVRNRKGVEILGVFISKDKKLGCPNRINEKILASRDNELSKRGVRQYQRSINAAESR